MPNEPPTLPVSTRICVRLDLQQIGHLVLQAERALVAGVEGVAVARGVVLADRRARLHGADDDAVADQPQARDVGCLGEGLGHLLAVAVVVVDADVAGRVVEHDRRAGLGGFARVGHGRQGVDVEHDRFGRVLGLGQGLGHDEGHRIADEAHLVGGQRMARRRLHRRAVAVGHRDQRLERPVARRVQVGAGPHAQHARHLLRVLDIDALEHAMRHLAAHHHRIGLVRQVHVVGVAALALEQGRVFLARHRLADAEFHQIESVRIGR